MSKILDSETVPVLDTIGLRFNQHGRDLYLFSLSAGEVHDLIVSKRMDIDRWSPSHQDGYQREPTDSRYKKFGKFVATTQGICPVSLVLSVRNPSDVSVENVPWDHDLFRLKIRPSGGTIYVPDGQHRAFGLKWAVEEYPGEVNDYQMPAVLFLADGMDPRYEEAQQFYTINSNAKRVRTDLAQRYLLRKREQELGNLNSTITIPIGTYKELEPYAVKIGDLVNADGPIKGKIQPPNTSSPDASISQSSFVDSLKPLLPRAAELRWDIGRTVAVINAFWGAVKSKCPKSFDHWSDDGCPGEDPDHFDAVLATTSGFYSLNDVLARCLLLPEVSKDPTISKTFEEILGRPTVEQYFTDGEEGYWNSESGGAAAHGTGRKSFKALADEIWEAIIGG